MLIQSMLLNHIYAATISTFMLIVILFSSFDLDLRAHFYTEEDPVNSEKDPVNHEKDEKLKAEILEDKMIAENESFWASLLILSHISSSLIYLFSGISLSIKAHAFAYQTFEFSYTYAPRRPPLI
jgi:hypothetical protein